MEKDQNQLLLPFKWIKFDPLKPLTPEEKSAIEIIDLNAIFESQKEEFFPRYGQKIGGQQYFA